MNSAKDKKIKHILISGGSGLLGSELQKNSSDIIAPKKLEFDITNSVLVKKTFSKYKPTIYIHCAALVGTDECSKDPLTAIKTNVLGVINTIKASIEHNCRYIFISSEYVFESNNQKQGNFAEEDSLNGKHLYSRTKISGEMIVPINPNHLIIRTSFVGRKKIKYSGAFLDQYTTRDYVDIIAPKILKAATSKVTGILHIGTEKKTQYELLKIAFPIIKPILRRDINPDLSKDTSLNTDKWNRLFPS